MKKVCMLTISLFCFAAGCGAVDVGDAALLTSPPVTTGGEPSDDISNPVLSTPERTPSLAPSSLPEIIQNPFDPYKLFDPYNSEGWNWAAMGGTDKDRIDMGKYIDSPDYIVEDFRLFMTLEDATPFFPSPPLMELDEGEDGFIPMKWLIFDSLILTFWQFYEDMPFTLISCQLRGNDYVTARGLCVGDSVETVVTLYGVPLHVDYFGVPPESHLLRQVEGIYWHYYDGAYSYNYYTIIVENDVVKEIWINGSS